MHHRWFSAISFIALSTVIHGALAADEYQAGVKSFKSNRIQESLAHFNKATSVNPTDSNALYYKAVCLIKLGRNAEGKAVYQSILQRFPNTDAAQQASVALSYGTARPAAAAAPATASTVDANAVLPAQVKLKFEMNDQDMIVDAHINTITTKMTFDPSFEGTVIGRNPIKSMNLAPSAGPIYKANEIALNLDVGGIKRNKFNMAVEDGDRLVLGKSFLKDYICEIDNTNSVINLTLKSGKEDTTAGLPYTRDGSQYVVPGNINGHACVVYADGNSAQSTLTPTQAKNLGLEVPELGPDEPADTFRTINVPYIKVGTMVRGNLSFTVINNEALDSKPITLGRPFFGDTKFVIDSEHKTLKIKR